MKLLIIVPAYNEAPVIASTLSDIRRHTKTLSTKKIVVIDDGSTDETFQKATNQKVSVLRHRLNRGLGGAIGTGLAYAKRHHFDIAVTIDADGQHDPRDIHTIIKPITQGKADVVIGSRSLNRKNQIPLDRRLLHFGSNFITQLLFSQSTTDSQSGFRAFNSQAINHIQIKTERMEVSSELFSEIKRLQLKLAEVPIKVLYTDYSRAKGQSNTNAIPILYKLVLRLFR